jgi:hypothetical protein
VVGRAGHPANDEAAVICKILLAPQVWSAQADSRRIFATEACILFHAAWPRSHWLRPLVETVNQTNQA